MQRMKILITGGAGFLGTLLARALLKRGTLQNHPITALTITDLAAPSQADIANHPLVRIDTGDLLKRLDTVFENDYDAVFHLSSAVSGECEADFDLGLRSNLDATRRMLDAMRAQQTRTGRTALFFFASSVAVFGSDPAIP